MDTAGPSRTRRHEPTNLNGEGSAAAAFAQPTGHLVVEEEQGPVDMDTDSPVGRDSASSTKPRQKPVRARRPARNRSTRGKSDFPDPFVVAQPTGVTMPEDGRGKDVGAHQDVQQVKHRLCLVLPLPSWIRHCLCLVFPLPLQEPDGTANTADAKQPEPEPVPVPVSEPEPEPEPEPDQGSRDGAVAADTAARGEAAGVGQKLPSFNLGAVGGGGGVGQASSGSRRARLGTRRVAAAPQAVRRTAASCWHRLSLGFSPSKERAFLRRFSGSLSTSEELPAKRLAGGGPAHWNRRTQSTQRLRPPLPPRPKAAQAAGVGRSSPRRSRSRRRRRCRQVRWGAVPCLWPSSSTRSTGQATTRDS